MRFFKQAGLAAAMATAASAVVVTETDIEYVTELVYVNAAGSTLSEVPYVASTVTPAAYTPPAYTTTTTTVAPTTTTTTTTTQAPTTLQTYYSPPPPPAPVTTTTTTEAAPPSYPTGGSGGSGGYTVGQGSCASPSAVYGAATDLCAGASNAQYCQGAIGAHNIHRSNHSAPAVKWNPSLEAQAQAMTNLCVFKDYLTTDGNLHQSNAFASSGTNGDAEAATHSWYGEEVLFAQADLYGNPNPPATVDGQEIGHFANVVFEMWTSIGCATTQCSTLNFPDGSTWNNAALTLCFYDNYVLDDQSYATNVLKPAGCPSYP